VGIQEHIDYDRFPKQGNWVGKRCEVSFRYDPTRTVGAECVREDCEFPRLTIFKLDDGRHVLATECMHSTPK